MQPVYSLTGQHMAWLSQNFVYDTAGEPLGYASGGSIFAFNADYIGELFSGVNYLWRGYERFLQPQELRPQTENLRTDVLILPQK